MPITTVTIASAAKKILPMAKTLCSKIQAYRKNSKEIEDLARIVLKIIRCLTELSALSERPDSEIEEFVELENQTIEDLQKILEEAIQKISKYIEQWQSTNKFLLSNEMRQSIILNFNRKLKNIENDLDAACQLKGLEIDTNETVIQTQTRREIKQTLNISEGLIESECIARKYEEEIGLSRREELEAHIKAGLSLKEAQEETDKHFQSLRTTKAQEEKQNPNVVQTGVLGSVQDSKIITEHTIQSLKLMNESSASSETSTATREITQTTHARVVKNSQLIAEQSIQKKITGLFNTDGGDINVFFLENSSVEKPVTSPAIPSFNPRLAPAQEEKKKNQISLSSLNEEKTKPRFAIGSSDFKKIIQAGHIFVDQSLLIKALIDDPTLVKLIIRPRRFGKTLLMRMIDCFFNIEEKDINRKLFESRHLNIWETENGRYQKKQGQYPVIFLTFKDIKGRTFAESYQQFMKLLSELYKKYKKILFEGVLLDNEDEKILYQNIIDKKCDQSDVTQAIFKLTKYLSEAYEKEVILLIDEYDTPIHTSYMTGGNYYEEMMNFMKLILSAALKDNNFLHQAILTGILRVAKETIFSGLNNLVIYSVLENTFNAYFGFTEEQVKQQLQDALDDKASSKLLEEIKYWYGGYQIGDKSMFNPWSVSRCIEHMRNNGISKKAFQEFWIDTVENKLINNILTQHRIYCEKELKTLIEGHAVSKVVSEHTVLADIKDGDKGPQALWGFLLLSGYLTFKFYKSNRSDLGMDVEETGYSDLIIPNHELRLFYARLLSLSCPKKLSDFIHCALTDKLSGNEEDSMKILIGVFSRISVGYIDYEIACNFLNSLKNKNNEIRIRVKNLIIQSNFNKWLENESKVDIWLNQKILLNLKYALQDNDNNVTKFIFTIFSILIKKSDVTFSFLKNIILDISTNVIIKGYLIDIFSNISRVNARFLSLITELLNNEDVSIQVKTVDLAKNIITRIDKSKNDNIMLDDGKNIDLKLIKISEEKLFALDQKVNISEFFDHFNQIALLILIGNLRKKSLSRKNESEILLIDILKYYSKKYYTKIFPVYGKAVETVLRGFRENLKYISLNVNIINIIKEFINIKHEETLSTILCAVEKFKNEKQIFDVVMTFFESEYPLIMKILEIGLNIHEVKNKSTQAISLLSQSVFSGKLHNNNKIGDFFINDDLIGFLFSCIPYMYVLKRMLFLVNKLPEEKDERYKNSNTIFEALIKILSAIAMMYPKQMEVLKINNIQGQHLHLKFSPNDFVETNFYCPSLSTIMEEVVNEFYYDMKPLHPPSPLFPRLKDPNKDEKFLDIMPYNCLTTRRRFEKKIKEWGKNTLVKLRPKSSISPREYLSKSALLNKDEMSKEMFSKIQNEALRSIINFFGLEIDYASSSYFFTILHETINDDHHEMDRLKLKISARRIFDNIDILRIEDVTDQTFLKSLAHIKRITFVLIKDDSSVRIFRHPSPHSVVYLCISNLGYRLLKKMATIPAESLSSNIGDLIDSSPVGQWQSYPAISSENLIWHCWSAIGEGYIKNPQLVSIIICYLDHHYSLAYCLTSIIYGRRFFSMLLPLYNLRPKAQLRFQPQPPSIVTLGLPRSRKNYNLSDFISSSIELSFPKLELSPPLSPESANFEFKGIVSSSPGQIRSWSPTFFRGSLPLAPWLGISLPSRLTNTKSTIEDSSQDDLVLFKNLSVPNRLSRSKSR